MKEKFNEAFEDNHRDPALPDTCRPAVRSRNKALGGRGKGGPAWLNSTHPDHPEG